MTASTSPRWWSDTSRANFVDYGLSWLATSLAVYSGGQAVGSNEVALFAVGVSTIGILFSLLVRFVLRQSKVAKIDGFLYCVGAWAAVIFARPINASIFPPETFPPELAPTSWLIWMSILGSFFVWRDGTLLFQSIPAIAMFGFVGCYDTYRPVVFLFFGFLICFAMLFSRAHAREMHVRATESGYFGVQGYGQVSESEKSELLRQGPWRWASGAEWALGSALIIVLLSLIGAPVIRKTAAPIAGRLVTRAPNIQNRNNPAVPFTPGSTSDIYAVSSGEVRLRDVPLFEVAGDTVSYYRIANFSAWGGREWRKEWDASETAIQRLNAEAQLLLLEGQPRSPSASGRSLSEKATLRTSTGVPVGPGLIGKSPQPIRPGPRGSVPAPRSADPGSPSSNVPQFESAQRPSPMIPTPMGGRESAQAQFGSGAGRVSSPDMMTSERQTTNTGETEIDLAAFNLPGLERDGVLSSDEVRKLKYPNLPPEGFLDDFRSKLLRVAALVNTNELPQTGNAPVADQLRFQSMDPSGLIALSQRDRFAAEILYDEVPDLPSDATAPKRVNWILAKCLRRSGIDVRFSRLALQIRSRSKSDVETANAIRQEISQTIRYNTKTPAAPAGTDAAAYAMFESKMAYCDAFATSMVLMSRSVGIPARFVIGYLADPKNVAPSGTQTLLESDRHAWAELYFEGVGWVPFDATEGAEVVEGGGRRDNSPSDPKELMRRLGYVLNALMIIGLIICAVLIYKIKTAPITPEIIRNELQKEYLTFANYLQSHTGRRRMPSETTTEYLDRIEPLLGSTATQARSIGQEFDILFFGVGSLEPAKIDDLRNRLKEFRSSLKHERSAKKGT